MFNLILHMLVCYVCCGVTLYGMVWYSIRNGMVCMVWYGMVWYGLAWHGNVSYRMTWCGNV